VVERIGAAEALIHAGDFSAASVLAELRELCPVGHSHLPLHEEEDGFQIFNPAARPSAAARPSHRWACSTPPLRPALRTPPARVGARQRNQPKEGRRWQS
jgi:hypothetical protein